MTIKLFTRDGGVVTEAEIPPFDDPPDVIVWGDRIFVVPSVERDEEACDAQLDEDVHAYVEAFAYVIPERV